MVKRSSQWKKVRKICFDRDKKANARCVHCDQPIDYSVPMSSTDRSYEPDHRIPVKDHPELELVVENIQPSCRSCNRRRGSRATIDALGNQSRQW